MTKFEFHAYAGDGEGGTTSSPEITFVDLRGDTFAKAKAARLCRDVSGPVDLAYAGDEPWDQRYITTAMPSEYHAKGYRLERLTD